MSEATDGFFDCAKCRVFDVKRNSLRPAGDVCAGIALTSRVNKKVAGANQNVSSDSALSQRDATQRRYAIIPNPAPARASSANVVGSGTTVIVNKACGMALLLKS